MASPPRTPIPLTLDEFLRMPGIDEHPYREFIDGRIEAKVAPQKKHSAIQKHLVRHLDDFAVPRSLGESFPELRCTFAGRSIVPDVVFLIREHIEADESGDLINETFQPPDLDIEIASPDQPVKKNRDKLVFSTSNGCPMGWLIDPERRTVEVYRQGRSRQRLPGDGVIEGDPVLPGYRLPVAELFGWLRSRGPGPAGPGGANP
jgi:Uma2 family endonuclease